MNGTAGIPAVHDREEVKEGDLDRGRVPDVAEYGLLRRDGSRELPPDMCLQGHQPQRWRQGWEPGKGRVFECTEPRCSSVQFRR